MESRSTDPPEEYSRPDYQISLDLDDLAAAHETSRAALDAGDYYIASRMAALENDPGTLGAALIMCGSVD
ncbi:MAG: hypothetical protein QGF09_13835, partial [Rhodospirillales bacterium]|nr:hypothetical protein [Rhodospirillales bacterium]